MTEVDRIAALERIIEELRRDLAEARRTIERQAEEIAKLRREAEEWRRGHRERRTRRTSGPEGSAPKPARKRGRPRGARGSNRPIPKDIDRSQTHAAPEVCTCGGHVEATGETKRTIVQDIPVVKVENVEHIAPVVRCTKCRRALHARLPGMSADGTTSTQVQVGPGIIALIESLRFEHKVVLRGIEGFVSKWFGVTLSSGGISHLLARVAEQNRPAVAEIEAEVWRASVAGADETGLREDGHGAYVWLVHTQTASLFRVERSRAAWVVDEMLGVATEGGFSGTLTTDFYAAYTRSKLPWTAAYCGGHLVREAKKFAEVTPSPATIGFSDRLSSLYSWGLVAQRTADEGLRDCVVVGFDDLASDETLAANPDVARLQRRIRKRFVGITLFLDRPDVPITNNWTEREIRFLASYRKVTGGTRSEAGSETLGHHLSVSRTLAKNRIDQRTWVFDAYWAHVRGQPTPSVLRATTPLS